MMKVPFVSYGFINELIGVTFRSRLILSLYLDLDLVMPTAVSEFNEILTYLS